MTHRPTDQLVAEHDRILILLDVLQRLAEGAERGAPDLEAITAAIRSVREYADACHHGKEEALLFPAMEQQGIPVEGGPLGCMLHEHEEGRDAVGDMSDALDAMREGKGGVEEFCAAVARFVPLLRQHIAKENQVLFPMAESVLTDEQKGSLIDLFARVERDDVGLECLKELQDTIDALATRWLGETTPSS